MPHVEGAKTGELAGAGSNVPVGAVLHLQDLNTLIPSNSGWLLTEATGINDTGQIVCNAVNTTGYYTHALLLNPI